MPCRGSVEDGEVGDKKKDHKREKGVHHIRTPVRITSHLYRKRTYVHGQRYQEMDYQNVSGD